jgi:hypothetical protein
MEPHLLSQQALGVLGKLRECVAAVRNLEHLVASRDIGAKVLKRVVPEVAAELEPFSLALGEMDLLLQEALALPSQSLSSLFSSAQNAATRFISELLARANSPFNAKGRLALEREIQKCIAPVSSALFQVELLVDAASSTGVRMTIDELLTSHPDSTNPRPRRTILVVGDAAQLEVTIPAKVGLRCLSMVASHLESSGLPCGGLEVTTRGGRHLLRFIERPLPGARKIEIPVYPHTPQSLTTVSAALQRFGGALEADHQGMTLPAP